MDIENFKLENLTLENCIIYFLIIVILFLLFKRIQNRRNRENYYSPNLIEHRVKVRCGNDDELGFRVYGEESYDTKSSDTQSSDTQSSDTQSSDTQSSDSSDITRDSRDLKKKKKYCVVDKMEDEVYKFATQERCDCNKKNGCNVCELKHSNDHEIAHKLCQERKKNFSCLVDKMESDNFDYMKGLMLGTILDMN
jgi:hypothetical protein